MIRNRVGSHSTDYLRHKKAGEHLRHSFEVFVRCLQGGRHNIFLIVDDFFPDGTQKVSS